MDQADVIRDASRWGEFSVLDPEYAELKARGIEPRFKGTSSIAQIPEVRARWHPMYRSDADILLAATGGLVREEEIFIPTRDGVQVRALVYRGQGEKSDKTTDTGCPLVVLIHGGGFYVGNAEMEAAGCISAVKEYGCIAVSLEYRLAPEVKFPTPFEDCWDALQWLISNAASMGADLAKGFVVGGSSAGGHITIPLVHRARDKRLSPPITGVYLSVPPALTPEAVTDKYRGIYRSRSALSQGLGLSAKSIRMFDEIMAPDFASPLWNPLLWHTGHGNLPPHYFQICGADMLRDEALIYERELRAESVQTRVTMYQGMPHVFWYTYPQHSVSRQFAQDTTNGIGWLLGLVD